MTATPIISDTDVYRDAKVVIERHGEAAAAYADGRIDLAFEGGGIAVSCGGTREGPRTRTGALRGVSGLAVACCFGLAASRHRRPTMQWSCESS